MNETSAITKTSFADSVAPSGRGRPLKIAIACAYDFASRGGVQTHIRELAHQFRAWGHDVRIVAPCSDPSKVTDEGFIPMGRPFPLPSRGSTGRISISIWLRPKIKRMLDEQQFDVIHMHEPFASYVCVGMLSQSNAVNIATFHSFPGSRLYKAGGSRIAQPYFKRLHGQIAVSQPAKQYISGIFKADYELIPNGVQIDQYKNQVTPFSHLQNGMINLLFLGRSDKRKGLKYLLLAYSKLKWDWPNLRLIVVGPGNPNPECQRIIAERSLKDVEFVGAVSDEDKARYFKTADLYCSPATGGESFGIVLVEAMAAGLPVVASDIPGYATVVRDEVEALMFPPKDIGALADSIARVLKDHDLKKRLTANGLRRAEEFRWERVARRVMDYYMASIERATEAPHPAKRTPLF
jgi:phosphatidylinositol alpha-mannosyltransferase